jgi:ligand-binding sensor domain-containing protein
MIFSKIPRNLLIVWALASLLSGCVGKAPLPVPGLAAIKNDSVPLTATTATIEELPATATPAPQLSPQDTPTFELPVQVKESHLEQIRPPSGWSLYSNPDFVQGVAVHGRQLWAATMGGVVAWDLDSGKPTLYTTRDGLVEIQSNDVVYCPLPEERILVAHSSGMLSAYDLKLQKWSRIPITFSDGGTLRSVNTLFCDAANQRLMAGSSDGLGILDLKTNRWKRIGPAEGLKVDTILAINVVGQAIWLAAGGDSAFMIMGSTIFPFNGASGFPSGSVYDLTVAPDTSIWFGYSTGLVHYIDKKWNSYGAQTPSGIPFLSVDQVELGPDKRVWIASAEEGICPFNPVTLFCSTVYPGTRGAPITDLVVGEDNVAYAATNGGGVLMLAEDQVRNLKFDQHQLMSNDIFDIAESPDGTLWIATDRGVNSFNPARPEEDWQSIKPRQGELAFPRVTGLLPVANGMWFFYERENQASFFDGGSWLQLDEFKELKGPILSALVDQRGYTWFATVSGINVWDGSVMRNYSPADDLRGNAFHALLEQNGTVWAGSDHGLLRYQRYQWQVILPDILINTIIPDTGDGLLLGTNQGLIRFDGSQSFLWIINLGDEVLTNPIITSMTKDGLGELWVGTDGSGLLHYDGKRWEQFNTASGLPTDIVRKVFTDRLGTVWIATVTGEGGGALARYVP